MMLVVKVKRVMVLMDMFTEIMLILVYLKEQ